MTLQKTTAILALLALAFGFVSAQGDDHPVDQPLTMASEVGFAPFVMATASGGVEGFSVDFCEAIAGRIGRPGCNIIDVPFSAIFSGLFSKNYEGIIAPTNITPERAEEMLYTEGYMAVGLGLMTLADEELNSLSDLEGKVVVVNNGNLSDTWATENSDVYGFTVERVNTSTDSLQTLLTRRAFVAIADLPGAQYAAFQNSRIKVSHVIDTGRNYGLVFRNDDVEFRNLVERAIEGLKLDGTLAELHLKWFGDYPPEDSAMNTVWFGYGPAGYTGFSADPHEPIWGND